jgi:phosphoribosylformimino-5-aminoimidazole carboxamide ribotide isomerase
VEFGGGIRTVSDVEQLHELGIATVVLGTLAAESMTTLSQLVNRFGSFIVAGIDARNGRVMTRGWEQMGELDAETLARKVAAVGVKRIVYTDISRDGMLVGPNIGQTIAVARAGGIKVTASGGVSSLDDLQRLAGSGEPLVDSVIVGKALYEGRFTFAEAKETLQAYQEN